MKIRVLKLAGASAIALMSICFALSVAIAADNLRLKDGISFVQDTDNGFPIIADNMDDAALGQGTPTLIFFGAAGDLNTNRQAKRLVDLSKKLQGKVKLIVVDVDHPANANILKLIKTYYKGYIPLNVILDKSGKQVHTHQGEIDAGELKSKIERLM